MKPIEKVAIVGRGAVGILYAMQFKRAGMEPVVIVDEDRRQRYLEAPVTVNGEQPDFDYGDVPYPVDLVLATTKGRALEEALELVEPWVGKDTVILPCQNGIISETVARARYPENPVIRTIVQGMDSTYLNNECNFTQCGEILYGPEREGEAEVCERLETFFEACGMANRNCADIIREQWNKLMLNCGINQVCAVYGTGYGGALEEPAYSDFTGAMKEVKAVANAQGIALTDADIAKWIETVRGLEPESMPSMAQDILAGRKTELNLFSGTICPLGDALGIDTPVLDSLKARIEALEENL